MMISELQDPSLAEQPSFCLAASTEEQGQFQLSGKACRMTKVCLLSGQVQASSRIIHMITQPGVRSFVTMPKIA